MQATSAVSAVPATIGELAAYLRAGGRVRCTGFDGDAVEGEFMRREHDGLWFSTGPGQWVLLPHGACTGPDGPDGAARSFAADGFSVTRFGLAARFKYRGGAGKTDSCLGLARPGAPAGNERAALAPSAGDHRRAGSGASGRGGAESDEVLAWSRNRPRPAHRPTTWSVGTGQVYASPSGVPLVGGYPFTASITVDLYGYPGPLNSDGLPVSLDGFLGAGEDITAEPGYHYGFSFQGDFSGQPQVQAVPEPSPLLAAATAVIGTAAAAGFRSRRAIGR